MSTELKYDTFFRRFTAKVIDYFLLGLLLKVIILFTGNPTYTLEYSNLYVSYGNYLKPGPLSKFWINYKDIILSLLIVLYFITLHYFFGQTIGKRIANVKVLNQNEVQKNNLSQAIIRQTPTIAFIAITYFIDSDFILVVILGIWYTLNLIQILSNKKFQTIEDRLAKTVVLRIFQKKIIVQED